MSLFSDTEPGSTTESSSADADTPDDGADESFVFPGSPQARGSSQTAGPREFTCEVCSVPIHYGGRGRHPRYCDDHKPGRSTSMSSGTGTRKRGKGKASDGVATVCTIAYGLTGYQLTQSEQPGPSAAGKMMQLQAPDAGKRIAKNLTPLLSRFGWLNTLSEHSGLAGDLGAILLPPLMVGAMAARPELQQAAQPILAAILLPLAKSMLEAQREQVNAMEQLGQVDAEVQDMLGHIMSSIFGEAQAS